MIVWVASYPRSGNGLLRRSLAERWALPTEPMPADSSSAPGSRQRSLPPSELRDAAAPTFVQTHRLADAQDEAPAIYVVRDGRDALVSYASYVARGGEEHRNFESLDLETISRRLIGDHAEWASWSENARAWIGRAAPTALVHFEELLADPDEALARALRELDLEPGERADAARRERALDRDFGYLRRGRVGSWQSELPRRLEELFWSRHGETMEALGYPREHPTAPRRPATLRPAAAPG